MQNLQERTGSLLKCVGLRQASFKEWKENKGKKRWRWVVALTGSYLKASASRYYCAFKCCVVLEMHGINSWHREGGREFGLVRVYLL